MKTPKPCPLCGQPATVFISFVTNSHIDECALCLEHAQQAGLLGDQAYALLGHSMHTVSQATAPTCPECGLTHHDFNRTGQFGCSHCYQVFKPLLMPILKKIQASVQHEGKVPSHQVDRPLIENRLKNLKLELDQAIQTEAFEDAARYRDEIIYCNQLLSQLSSPQAGG